MKQYSFKFYQLFLLLGIIVSITSCREDLSEIGDLTAPTNLTVAADVADDGSGIVNFNATADDAIVYHYFFGTGVNETPTISSNGSIQQVYRSSGDYDVKIIAYGPGGVASNAFINISVEVVYEIPSDLQQALTGGSSREWRWYKEVPGHLGVGPTADDTGIPVGEPIWYQAQAFEKESEGCLYNDIMTFSLDNNKINLLYDNMGSSYFNRGEVNQALGQSAPENDACYDFEAGPLTNVGFFQSDSGLENTTDISFLIGSNGFLSYYLGSSTYEILSYNEDQIDLRVIQTDDAGAQFAWYQKLIAVDAETNTGGPDIEYELIWEDDFLFNGPPSSSKWSYDIGTGNNGWGNGESQYYTDRTNNTFIENGILNIVAKREAFANSQFTSGRIKTQDKFEFTYGKVEILAKLPTGGGTWPALWMLGANFDVVSWPACGEIDIMEHVGNDQDRISSALHSPSSFGGTINTNSLVVNGVSEEFHLYEVEWTDESIRFSVDGSNFYTYNPDNKNPENWPFNKDFFLIFNVAMGGGLGGDIDPQFNESVMQVDYVKVYQAI